jgi:excisionase family DNA binding protein
MSHAIAGRLVRTELAATPQGCRKLSYTVNEACAAIGISRRKFYQLRQAGELETFCWGGRTLIREDVLRTAVDRASGRLSIS